MSIQIPFPLPSKGFALNSKIRVNLDFIVDQFNKFNTGVATWDTVDIGVPNSIDGVVKLYHSNSSTYTKLVPSGHTLSILPVPAGYFDLYLNTAYMDVNDDGSTSENMGFFLGRAGRMITMYNTAAAGTFIQMTHDLMLDTDLLLGSAAANRITIKKPVTVTSYTLTFPNAQGGPSTVLTNDGSGGLSWAPIPASGANAALSNLASVAINASLLPGSDNAIDLGSTAKYWQTGYITGLVIGKDGRNGWIDLYPPTSSKGFIEIYASNNAGNTGINITNASQAGARTYTIPDAGGNAGFCMNPSAVGLQILPNTNQLILGGTGGGYTRTISLSGALADSNKTYYIAANSPDGSSFIMGNSLGGQQINGGDLVINTDLVIAGTKKLKFSDGLGGTLSFIAPASITTYTLTVPATDGTTNQVLKTDGAGHLSWTDGAITSYRESYIVGTAVDNYSGSTTVFDLVGKYTTGNNSLVVCVDGVIQRLGASYDYVETDTDTVTFNSALLAGQTVTFMYGIPSAIGDTTTVRENYIVGTASGSYTGSTTVFDLTQSYTVGAQTLMVFYDGVCQTLGASADYQETSATRVTFLNALTSGHAVSFIFTVPVSNSGIVNSGTAGQVAYYATSSSTLSTTDKFLVASTGASVKGTNTNDSAAAGYVGEYVISSVTSYQNAGNNNQFKDVTSISLTAGDWDVVGQIISYKNSSTLTQFAGAVSLYSGNTTTDHTESSNVCYQMVPIDNTGQSTISICYRVSVSTTTNVYLKTKFQYSGGTPQYAGTIRARRIR